jgi:hypothetical protein
MVGVFEGKKQRQERNKELVAWAIAGRLHSLSSCPTASQGMKDAPVLCRLPNNKKKGEEERERPLCLAIASCIKEEKEEEGTDRPI